MPARGNSFCVPGLAPPTWGVLNSLAQYPHWFVVACATVAAALVLWLLIKLIKAALWMLFFGIVIVGAVAAVWMFLR